MTSTMTSVTITLSTTKYQRLLYIKSVWGCTRCHIWELRNIRTNLGQISNWATICDYWLLLRFNPKPTVLKVKYKVDFFPKASKFCKMWKKYFKHHIWCSPFRGLPKMNIHTEIPKTSGPGVLDGEGIDCLFKGWYTWFFVVFFYTEKYMYLFILIKIWSFWQ